MIDSRAWHDGSDTLVTRPLFQLIDLPARPASAVMILLVQDKVPYVRKAGRLTKSILTFDLKIRRCRLDLPVILFIHLTYCRIPLVQNSDALYIATLHRHVEDLIVKSCKNHDALVTWLKRWKYNRNLIGAAI